MQRKDIYTFIAVGLGSAIFSFTLSNLLISPPENRTAQVEVVEPFSDEFNELPSQYFNAQSVNPTRVIRVDGDPNNQPFGAE